MQTQQQDAQDLVMGSAEITESQWLAGDLERARRTPEQREAERVRIAHQLDVDAARRAGL